MNSQEALKVIPMVNNLKVKDVNRFFAADFETPTINTKFFKNRKSADDNRINAACFIELNSNNAIFSLSVAEFINQLFNQLNNGEIGQVFFHNLSKFDGFVLIDYLRSNWNLNTDFLSDSKDKFKGLTYELSYSFMVADGKIYKIEIFKKSERKAIIFTCSYLLMSVSLAAIGKVVGQNKTTTNYDVEPANSLNEYPSQYLDYLKNDVEVLKKGLNLFKDQLAIVNKCLFKDGEGVNWNKLTAASISRDILEKSNINGLKISSKEQLKAIPYYSGGFCNFNEKYIDQVVNKNIKVFDAKSHYPTQMSLKKLPLGNPQVITINDLNTSPYINGKLNNSLIVGGGFNDYDFITIKGEIKKAKYSWGVLKKVHKTYTDFIYETQPNQPFEFKGTWFEWKEVIKFYEFKEYVLTEYVKFEKSSKTEFKNIVDALYEMKETQPNPLTFKIILNSLYGSMGLHHKNEQVGLVNENGAAGEFKLKITDKKGKDKPVIYKTASLDFQPLAEQNIAIIEYVPISKDVDEVLVYDEFDDEINDLVKEVKDTWNIWIAAAITSFARTELYKKILIDPENVVYCDTDSVFILESDKLDEHFKKVKGSNLGNWDQEYANKNINKFQILQPKLYNLWENNVLIKSGAVGVDKKLLVEKINQDNNFLCYNTYIENGTIQMVKGLSPKFIDYLNNPTNFKKVPKYLGSCFPWIISRDKELKQLKSRREITNEKKTN